VHAYVCLCCGQSIIKKIRRISSNPKICAVCSALADGGRGVKDEQWSQSKFRHFKRKKILREPFRLGKAA